MSKAMIIISHGTRSAEAEDIFSRIVKLVQFRSDFQFVEKAYFEETKPSPEDSVRFLSKNGVNEIYIVPFILIDEIHIEKYLSGVMEMLGRNYPKILFKVTRPLGFDPSIADLILKRVSEQS
jgi:sirohydrochlorin ferrochelatase